MWFEFGMGYSGWTWELMSICFGTEHFINISFEENDQNLGSGLVLIFAAFLNLTFGRDFLWIFFQSKVFKWIRVKSKKTLNSAELYIEVEKIWSWIGFSFDPWTSDEPFQNKELHVYFQNLSTSYLLQNILHFIKFFIVQHSFHSVLYRLWMKIT